MRITALAGGVGGAKLVDGISRLDPGVDLTVVVNTGDDFSHFGLWICPDLDTVCYNLANLANLETGWGRAEENWDTLREIRILGGPDWFNLGNKDLAVHLERTRRLACGQPLSRITADFCSSWGIGPTVLPMSDDQVPTQVQTDQGILPFQEYFVRLKCEPRVKGFIFQDIDQARPAPGVLAAINEADLVIICPSNPWVSIDPILSLEGIREALGSKVVVGISPLIGGEAVKGPAAKMYRELDIEPSAAAVAGHYSDLLDGFMIDESDLDLRDEIISNSPRDLSVHSSNIWMKDRQQRRRVAEAVVAFGRNLGKEV